mmetsp:Transcript_123467/g.283070  ORF Transcript_123467/g.283070 Transcript_123467/m.283070 type:complete len:116 (-) Transcript_123467:857-1204(-)
MWFPMAKLGGVSARVVSPPQFLNAGTPRSHVRTRVLWRPILRYPRCQLLNAAASSLLKNVKRKDTECQSMTCDVTRQFLTVLVAFVTVRPSATWMCHVPGFRGHAKSCARRPGGI